MRWCAGVLRSSRLRRVDWIRSKGRGGLLLRRFPHELPFAPTVRTTRPPHSVDGMPEVGVGLVVEEGVRFYRIAAARWIIGDRDGESVVRYGREQAHAGLVRALRVHRDEPDGDPCNRLS